eukprot:13112-Heterococcus_DN1.PRE.7
MTLLLTTTTGLQKAPLILSIFMTLAPPLALSCAGLLVVEVAELASSKERVLMRGEFCTGALSPFSRGETSARETSARETSDRVTPFRLDGSIGDTVGEYAGDISVGGDIGAILLLLSLLLLPLLTVLRTLLLLEAPVGIDGRRFGDMFSVRGGLAFAYYIPRLLATQASASMPLNGTASPAEHS